MKMSYDIKAKPVDQETYGDKYDFTPEIENIWQAAKQYAEDNGLKYHASYGVEGVGAT
jgi:hypothetical protein